MLKKCACGCGEATERTWARGHHKRKPVISYKPPSSPEVVADTIRAVAVPIESLPEEAQESIQEACRAEGMDEVFIAKAIKELTSATTSKYDPGIKQNIELPDWVVRSSAVEKLIKIYGGFKNQSSSVNFTIHAQLENLLRSDASADEVNQVLDRLISRHAGVFDGADR